MLETEQRRLAWQNIQAAHRAQTHGDLAQAVALYRESLRLFPSAEAYTFLGWTYGRRGRLLRAIALCRRAIEIDPSFGNPYNDIGAYLIELGRLDEAVPWLERATRAPRYDSYCFPWMNLGRVRERQGHWFEAMDCYKKALQCNPNFRLAARALARIRGRLN